MTEYLQTNSLVPSTFTSGLYKARPPFDTIVNELKQYTCHEIRTVKEMKRLNLDTHKLIFDPIEVGRTDGEAILTGCEALSGSVITLVGHDSVPVYVLSTFLESIPLSDGVPYEICAIMANMGSISTSEKDSLTETCEYIKNYILATLGIETDVKVGGVGYRTYVSKEQHEQNLIAREVNITQKYPDVILMEDLRNEIKDQNTYIAELEEALVKAQK